MDTLIQQCLDAADACQTASREYEAAFEHRDLLGSVAAFRKAEARALRALRDARAACRQQFAKERNWTVARTPFTSGELIDGRRASGCGEQNQGVIDHPDCFRSRRRPFFPAGILSHTYKPIAACEAFAEAHGLRMEVLPASWYSRSTTAVMFTKADT